MFRILLTLFVPALLVACSGEPRLQTSTEKDYNESIAAMRESLTPEQRSDLDAALQKVWTAKFVGEGNNSIGAMTPAQLLMSVGNELEGKTAREIIVYQLGNEAENLRRQVQNGEAAIAQTALELEAADKILSTVVLENPRFYWSNSGFLEQPVIAFKVRNEGQVAVKTIFVDGVVETPGRSIPWISDEFNYSFPGGLEPGEVQQLELSPNMFGGWAEQNTKGRKDLVLSLTLRNFEGPDGNDVVPSSMADIGELQIAVDKAKSDLSIIEAKISSYN